MATSLLLVAAVGGLAWLWRGPLKGWEVPEQPLFGNRLVTLPSAFLMVLGFFYATPETAWQVLLLGGALAAAAVIGGVVYAGKIMLYRRFKEVVSSNNVTSKVPVLAGDQLTAAAAAACQNPGMTDQDYFAGAGPYNPNLVWPLPSRVRVYKRLMWLFIVTLFCGTGALAWLAYGVEVKVTGKPASQILNPSQIPTDSPKHN